MDRGEIGFHAAQQGPVLAEGALRDAFLPQMIPNELVRVEIGGVAGEEVGLDPTPLLLHELRDQMSPVRRMAVDHEEDRLPAVPEEGLEEGPEGGGVQSAREHFIPEGPEGAHGGDRVHRLPLADLPPEIGPVGN